MYISILFILIMAGCLAFMVNNGLWTNALMFVNVLLAALLAMAYFEPLADSLEGKLGGSYTYLMDFMAYWIIFAAAVSLFRAATDKISRVNVRFKKPIDVAGGIFFALWTGWLMMCFAATTLHTAPLARNFFFGDFQPEPSSRMFFGLAPDRTWLAFTQKESKGALARSAPANNPGAHVFDPQGAYILKYGARRAAFEAEPGTLTNAK